MEEEISTIDYAHSKHDVPINNLHLKPTLPTRANFNGGKQGTTDFVIPKENVEERKTMCMMASHDFTRRRTVHAINPKERILSVS